MKAERTLTQKLGELDNVHTHIHKHKIRVSQPCFTVLQLAWSRKPEPVVLDHCWDLIPQWNQVGINSFGELV
jgi:hypothetical protein